MFSITNSLLFLLSVRSTLSEFVDTSEDITERDKRKLKTFFMEQGTDYEVMHFFVRGSFPKNRFDSVDEVKVHEELKSHIRENFIPLKKFVDEETVKIVLTELAPITPKGLSSSTVILEMIAAGNVNLTERSREEWNKKAEKVYQRIRKVPGKVLSALEKSAQQGKIHSITAYISKHKKGLTYMAAGVVVALATLAAYKIYKNKLTPAAKACKQYTGPEKANCMAKYKLDALKAQHDALKTALSACSNTAEPEKCRTVLDNKIKKVEGRISRLSKQV